eukprot:CAMPEP_0181229022 /NCGR_PEP_ID=MMETSP1096-20121128/33666_1 /TAXON_ID=156174 ORGANISM="Chrysochromulina ericina, Strain CCMP281" /NCGR_SAMPLE_ID=MMETSP1096 /ASSEMBLY_ACC=CAM_ASM_000453 /LENGTH=105 /DNA_ID=CAMNT_0023322599 /DNA_START=111 /DNA_END=428 /DNA_ORIENTATION=+
MGCAAAARLCRAVSCARVSGVLLSVSQHNRAARAVAPGSPAAVILQDPPGSPAAVILWIFASGFASPSGVSPYTDNGQAGGIGLFCAITVRTLRSQQPALGTERR